MMNRITRLALFLLILGLLLFLGLIFSSWTMPNIVLPAAQAVWLFLRMFILSVSQEFYWWLLASCAAIWALYQLSRVDEPVREEVHVSYNEALNNQKLWKELLAFSKGDAVQRDILKQRLILLLASIYNTWQRDTTLLEVRQALESHQLPLPDSLYAFLFTPEPDKPGGLSVRSLFQAFRRKVRRWSGKEAAEFNNMIDELIEFMENSSEKEYE